jgi:hypothetical protein
MLIRHIGDQAECDKMAGLVVEGQIPHSVAKGATRVGHPARSHPMDEAKITRLTFVEALRSSVPDFVISEWADDGLGYVIVNDLARYICDQATVYDFEAVKRGTSFLEMCLAEGDSYTRDLVVEGLETLMSCRKIDAIKEHFGPLVAKIWNGFSEHGKQG